MRRIHICVCVRTLCDAQCASLMHTVGVRYPKCGLLGIYSCAHSIIAAPMCEI